MYASVFGFVEALIYVFGLSLVFSGDQSTLAMVVYAVGFGVKLSLEVISNLDLLSDIQHS